MKFYSSNLAQHLDRSVCFIEQNKKPSLKNVRIISIHKMSSTKSTTYLKENRNTRPPSSLTIQYCLKLAWQIIRTFNKLIQFTSCSYRENRNLYLSTEPTDPNCKQELFWRTSALFRLYTVEYKATRICPTATIRSRVGKHQSDVPHNSWILVRCQPIFLKVKDNFNDQLQ